MEQSKHLHGDGKLESIARELEQHNQSRLGAIENAIDECIEHGISTEPLTGKALEVANMLLEEWNLEDEKNALQREAEEEGLALGKEEGLVLGEARSDQKWESVVEDISAQLAEAKAQMAELMVQQ